MDIENIYDLVLYWLCFMLDNIILGVLMLIILYIIVFKKLI